MDREPQRNSLDAYWMPFTANRAFKANPRLFASAQGMYFRTTDGREVMDGVSAMWCSNAGHGRPRIASPDETRAFAAYVAPLCPHRLKSGIDPRRVARTRFYMADDGEAPERHELTEAVESDFPALKQHLSAATQRGHGLLMWMA